MPRWLFKHEADEYSFADREWDGRAVWDGVSNAVALKHLRAAAVGDEAFYYHTGKEKAVVGEMKVVGGPWPDANDETLVVVDVAAVRRLKRPVTLAEIKADAAFA